MRIKEYKIKKLIEGQYLGRQFVGKYYVAIPASYFEKDIEGVLARFGSWDKYISRDVVPVYMKDFPDKWGRGVNYVLNYYVWGELSKGGEPDEPHTIPMF